MKPYKILVADDDSALLASIRIRLSSAGYEVFCAQDGYQAVQLAVKERPDLLILDINMPAGSGFSVQDRILNHGRISPIPIVYMTGDRSHEVHEKISKNGAPSLLYKPFYTADLLERIQDALEQYKSGQESMIAQ